jgi:4-amino-4-deoxy-L-arabinose transferase-like glycosyltransferase
MIDKPPAAVWLIGLSVRLFGLNSWSVLAPQALLGVASVALLYLAVRRWAGTAAALAAGLVLALTPVATLMARFDNPDALLVTLLVAAAYAVVRAVDAERDGRAGTRWLLLAGALVGAGFLTKSLQAFLVLPGLAAAYLAGSVAPWPRRVGRLLAGGAATVLAGGWWVAAVELWPAADRPYVGGSQTNSVLELVFGYNGLGRLTGEEVGSLGGGMGGGSALQLFDGRMATQASWLLPAALLLIGALLVLRRWASAALWGGWLLITGLVFSLAEGVIHEYYTVALAPAIAALVGIGGVELVRRRHHLAARMTLAVAVAGTGLWSWWLLGSSAGTARTALLVAAVLAALGWLIDRTPRALVAASLLVALAAPAAYSVQTASTAHSGALPSAGPGRGFGPARGPGGGPGGFGGPRPGGDHRAPPAGFPGGPGGPRDERSGRGPGGGFMVLLQGVTPSAEVAALLKGTAAGRTWVAATVGSEPAASYQLAAAAAVMPIGGFNGTDPAPTLERFQALVAAGQVRWFIDSGAGGSGPDTGGSDAARRITEWVHTSFTPVVIGGTTLYDLTAAR